MNQPNCIRTFCEHAASMMRCAKITPPILYNTLNISEFCFVAKRAATMLLMMLLTTATWAAVINVASTADLGTLTEDPATENAHAPELLNMDEDW